MKGNSGRSGGHKGGGRRGDREGDDRSLAQKTAVRRKAEKLTATTGIPRAWAWQVAQGKATLNEVLTRLARQDRIEQLERRYQLDRSTAAQVADGTQDLDEVLLRQRLVEHLEQHGGRSVFDAALASGQPLVLHLHGLRTQTARVVAVDPYELELETDAGRERVHKLQVKLAHAVDVDPKLDAVPGGRQEAEVRPRPQDRFHSSDRRLYAWLDIMAPLRIRTLEGDLVRGSVSWIARWELGIQTKAGEVVIMRHALAGIEEN